MHGNMHINSATLLRSAKIGKLLFYHLQLSDHCITEVPSLSRLVDHFFNLWAIHLWRPQKIGFLTPLPLSTCVHMSQTPSPPLWTSTCGRHKIHIALLKRLVQWPFRPKAEIRLYDCNSFKTRPTINNFITNYIAKNFQFLFHPKTKFW